MNIYKIFYKHVSKGESGEICGSKYSLKEACTNCGTGALLINNLRVKGISKVNKDIFATMDRDHLISKNLHFNMEVLGIKFGKLPLVETTKSELLPFYNLNSQYFLPKFSCKTIGYEIDNQAQCYLCQQNCYFGIPNIELELHYNELPKELLEKSDIFCTWEHWGYSFKEDGRHNLKYSKPSLIVTEKFKNAIEKLGIKYVLFSPIIVDKWV